VIGAGYWGPNLVRNFHELPGSEVVSVCDLREDLLVKIGRRYPAVKLTSDIRAVLEDPAIEAVAIATPVSTHAALVTQALEAGKHVLVEKPMAATTAEAKALIELASERGLVMMPGHTFVYSPPVNAIRDLILAGELGDIYFVSMSRVNLGLHQPDVSVVWDLGPHDFSILLYWLEEMPTTVAATSRGCILPDTPDVAFIHLGFGAQTIAHVELSWLAPHKLRRTAIVGSKKMVVYDDSSTEQVRIFDNGAVIREPESFGEYRLTYRTGNIVSLKVDPVEPLSLELADFCRAVRTGEPPRSSSSLGIDVIRIVEAVDRSLASAGMPVQVEAGSPLPEGGRRRDAA
jgi:predicted dehydrogenase